MAVQAKQSKGTVKITQEKAKRAVRVAKDAYSKGKKGPSVAWKKGGKEYAKVLGHFGLTDSSK